ncbi:MAG: RecB family exonuclease [Candidatus Xenobiia bacterium LiM19]
MERYSYSRISTYEQCPQRYKYLYIDRLKDEQEGIEAFTGSRVHEALEFLYRHVQMAEAPAPDEVIAFYDRRWDELIHDRILVTSAEFDSDHYRSLGRKALRVYQERYSPFDEGTTMGLEQRVEFFLDSEEKYPFIGIIDRLTRISDAHWEVHDYKTGGTLPTQPDMDRDNQLALYHFAITRLYPQVKEVTLIWHYLAFDMEFRSSRSDAQLEELRSDFIRKIDVIETQTEFPTKSGILCGWCGFKSRCPAWKHEMALREMSDEEARQDEGLSLVDRYMKIDEEVTHLEEEKERLKKAIIAKAQLSDIHTLTGSSHKIRVWPYRQCSLPEYNDSRRGELESIIKSLGLWERFSTLSSTGLSKALENLSIPEEARSAIMPYIRFTDNAKLYPRKR